MSWEMTLGYPGGPRVMTGVLIIGRQEDQREEVTTEAEVRVTQGPRPRNVGSL